MIDSPRGNEHREGEGKDLYELYADFERRFLQWSIAISSVEWVQLYYRRSFQLMTRDAFDRWFRHLPRRAQRFHRRKWEEGFDTWLAKEQERGRKLSEHIRKHGVPRRIQRIVEDAVRELDATRTKNKEDAD